MINNRVKLYLLSNPSRVDFNVLVNLLLIIMVSILRLKLCELSREVLFWFLLSILEEDTSGSVS